MRPTGSCARGHADVRRIDPAAARPARPAGHIRAKGAAVLRCRRGWLPGVGMAVGLFLVGLVLGYGTALAVWLLGGGVPVALLCLVPAGSGSIVILAWWRACHRDRPLRRRPHPV